ncbi:MAG TPA: hypothetical protein VHB79_34005 [Polyangiaceae bacterium]|nr:hypothetical protein [Polyangiaceae bacterium]
MPVISFYGLNDELVDFGRWLNAQDELAVIEQQEQSKLFAAIRNANWQPPFDHRLLWCTAGSIEAIRGGDFERIEDPWTPFAATDVYPGDSIFQVRFVAEVAPQRLGLSSIQWSGRGEKGVRRVFQRIRGKVARDGQVVDRLAGEPRFALPLAKEAIDSGYSFARDPFQ